MVPSSSNIEVTSPLLRVDFSQLRVTISGSVKCIEECHPSISVKLSSLSKETRLTTGLGGLSENSLIEKFVFSDVLPGKYEITIEKEDFCWQNSTFLIEATTKGHQEIFFAQKGYYFTCSSSHQIDLEYSHTASQKENGASTKRSTSLKKGNNKICLPKAGVYQISPKSCYKFEKENYLYDTSSPSPISFTPTHFKVEASITVFPTTIVNPLLSVNFTSNSFSESITLPPSSTSKKLISFHFWAPAKLSHLYITPFETQNQHNLLFYPNTNKVTIEKESCPTIVPPFTARPGLMFEGQVTPTTVKQVEISVYDEQDNSLIASTITNQEGKYKIGPFYDTQTYRLEAKKEGYSFIELENNNFKVIKLCSIHLQIVDQTSNQPIDGVFLSLTSSFVKTSYRANNVTSPNGDFTFKNLLPSVYFLKPKFKEYSFHPSSLQVNLSSGEDYHTLINATRIAYSCFGKLSYLNKKPEPDAHISALSFTRILFSVFIFIILSFFLFYLFLFFILLFIFFIYIVLFLYLFFILLFIFFIYFVLFLYFFYLYLFYLFILFILFYFYIFFIFIYFIYFLLYFILFYFYLFYFVLFLYFFYPK